FIEEIHKNVTGGLASKSNTNKTARVFHNVCYATKCLNLLDTFPFPDVRSMDSFASRRSEYASTRGSMNLAATRTVQNLQPYVMVLTYRRNEIGGIMPAPRG
ncbi:hypothetical protein, partial [Sinorhizobium psoraleae]|uniref:hypothetical protein n=1 Tax=Sinorhizobium psoraleae TaxID=520838 RepID=UPI001AEE9E3C